MNKFQRSRKKVKYVQSSKKAIEDYIFNNYRPETLLKVVYKIFAILLHNRVCTIAEHKIGEY
jgi:hypothetical protein